jgi:pimeloyl-ACP methyl ester carboxylesterase
VSAAIGDAGPEPVYLLAHSLGGIICADLLVREPVPGVAGLITVGSQTPFMYEIGAFPALSHPDPLPGHMPRWLNVYDRRDLLSYMGGGVFDGRVRDVGVDNGQPFPQSHSAYWTNPALWAAVAAFTA